MFSFLSNWINYEHKFIAFVNIHRTSKRIMMYLVCLWSNVSNRWCSQTKYERCQLVLRWISLPRSEQPNKTKKKIIVLKRTRLAMQRINRRNSAYIPQHRSVIYGWRASNVHAIYVLQWPISFQHPKPMPMLEFRSIPRRVFVDC